MRLYEDIIRERAAKNPDYRNGLMGLESKRQYHVRIEGLRKDIARLDDSIRALMERLARLDGDWMARVSRKYLRHRSQNYCFTSKHRNKILT